MHTLLCCVHTIQVCGILTDTCACLRRVPTHLSSDALSSSTACLYEGPRRARARQRILVVFPVPGGPYTAIASEDTRRMRNSLPK